MKTYYQNQVPKNIILNPKYTTAQEMIDSITVGEFPVLCEYIREKGKNQKHIRYFRYRGSNIRYEVALEVYRHYLG